MRYLTILLLFALLTGAAAARAQAGRSEITGVVHDQSGALLPQGSISVSVIQPPSPTGSFNFNTLFTNSQAIPSIGSALSSFTGNALANFLLGQVQNFSIDIQQNVLRPRAHVQEYFVQDDFKATPRLTINAGLRYTLNYPSTEADNQSAVFNLQTQKLDYLGQNAAGDPRVFQLGAKFNF